MLATRRFFPGGSVGVLGVALAFGLSRWVRPVAMQQSWAFLVFPPVGAAVGAGRWLAIDDSRTETTPIGPTALVDVRDTVLEASGQAEAEPSTQTP